MCNLKLQNFNLLEKYSKKRLDFSNKNNGHHNIGCVIYDKKTHWVLRVWLQQV